MDRIASVYAVCFPNGKLYVGITTKTAEQRFQAHIKSDKPVGCAIRHFGPESVRVVVLRRGLPWAEACRVERYYVRLLQSRIEQNGYNLTDGGEGVLRLTESSQKKKSEAIKRRYSNDPVFREAMRIAQQKATQAASESRRGRPMSTETKTRISTANRGKVRSPEHKDKLRRANLGKKISEATRKKLSRVHRDKYNSDPVYRETRLKALELATTAAVKANRGRRLSTETRQRMSDAHQRKRVQAEVDSVMQKVDSLLHGLTVAHDEYRKAMKCLT